MTDGKLYGAGAGPRSIRVRVRRMEVSTRVVEVEVCPGDDLAAQVELAAIQQATALSFPPASVEFSVEGFLSEREE